MESTTSFDLTREIQQWRNNLAVSPAFRGENLNELESHLRDSIATLQSQGLAPDEAFIVAYRRIGKGSSLATEFAKVNSRALLFDRALWMLVGIQLWGVAYGIIHSTALDVMSLGWRSWYSMHDRPFGGIPIMFISVAQILALMPTLFVCWWLVTRNGERLAKWLAPLLNRRLTLAAACAWLCFVSIGAYTLSYLLRALSPGYIGVPQNGTLNNVYMLIGPYIQTVALMLLTLTLARKRLRLN